MKILQKYSFRQTSKDVKLNLLLVDSKKQQKTAFWQSINNKLCLISFDWLNIFEKVFTVMMIKDWRITPVKMVIIAHFYKKLIFFIFSNYFCLIIFQSRISFQRAQNCNSNSNSIKSYSFFCLSGRLFWDTLLNEFLIMSYYLFTSYAIVQRKRLFI